MEARYRVIDEITFWRRLVCVIGAAVALICFTSFSPPTEEAVIEQSTPHSVLELAVEKNRRFDRTVYASDMA